MCVAHTIRSSCHSKLNHDYSSVLEVSIIFVLMVTPHYPSCDGTTEFKSSLCPLETEPLKDWDVIWGGEEGLVPMAMLDALIGPSSLWVRGRLPGSSKEDRGKEVCGEVGDLGEDTRRDLDRFQQHSHLFHCCLTREARTTWNKNIRTP